MAIDSEDAVSGPHARIVRSALGHNLHDNLSTVAMTPQSDELRAVSEMVWQHIHK